MKPSRLFLALAAIAVVLALITVVLAAQSVRPFGLPPFWLALAPMGLLVGATLIDWIISTGPRGLRVNARGMGEIYSGEVLEVDFHLTSARKKGRVPENAKGLLAESEGFSLVGGQAVEAVEAENPAYAVRFHRQGEREASARLTLKARKRGRWPLGKIHVLWPSRLRLIQFNPVLTLDYAPVVVPNLRPVTSGEIDLKLKSEMFGGKVTRRRGEGSDFLQLNDFVQGMDPRTIDWKRSARVHQLLARQMQAERNHQVIIALDTGAFMGQEIEGLPKLDHAINATLALGWAVVQSGDQLGLYAFDSRPQLFVPPRGGRSAHSGLRHRMGDLPGSDRETNHSLALTRLHQRLNKRSLIIVCSDFADPMSAQLLLDHMTVINRHHVVVFLTLRDPLLAHTMDGAVGTMDDMAAAVSAGRMAAERLTVLRKMASMGVHVIEANAGQITPRLINTYLAIKQREEI